MKHLITITLIGIVIASTAATAQALSQNTTQNIQKIMQK